MKRVHLILIILCISLSSRCQVSYKQIYPTSITKLDTTFRSIIANHLHELLLNGHYDPIDSFIVIYILPTIIPSDGVPQRIIDSIYHKNVFPLTPSSINYKIVVMSLPYDCSAFNTLQCFNYQYCTRVQDKIILIVSELDIDFPNANEQILIKICSVNPCEKYCVRDLNKTTTYIMNDNEITQTKFIDIWLRNMNLINHPGK